MQSSAFGFAGTFRRVVALSLLVGLAGCGSGNKGYEQGMKTGSNLQDLAKKMEATDKQMDTTLAQADTLVNGSGGDMRKQFDQYRKSLKSLEGMATDVRGLADDMTKRSDAYFAQWEKDIAQIKNEDIKSVSAQRRNERMAQFTDIKGHFAGVRDAFRPFMQDLRDIEQALSVELTSGSVQSMKPFVSKAKTDAVPLEKALNDLRSEFKELGVQMSPTKS